ncbi:MAG: S8 family serine peptidase, partial [Planctomycetota bacterium]
MPDEFVLGIQQDANVTDVLESLASNLTTSLAVFDNVWFDEVVTLEAQGDRDLSVLHVGYAGDVSLSDVLAYASFIPEVSWAAPNYQYSGEVLDFLPDDPAFGDQYHHTLMGNPVAWDVTLGDSDVVIAVTDEGVELDHPDLAPNIWENTAEVRGVAGVDDDSNGYIDDFNGWDFVGDDNDPNPLIKDDDHGTHVAGIAAGVTNNGNQIAGVAGHASILPIRISGADGGFTSVIMADAFAYAIDNGARIANTSFNINGFVGDPTFTAGLQYYYDNGGLHFNSAGNDDQLNPARQAFHQTLLVASTTSLDEKSDFSNYGTGIDVAAPGSAVLSTVTIGGIGFKSGTSMSAPNAAGAAALIWSANPSYTRDQVAAQLLGTADNIDAENPEYVGLLGSGRVNTGRALAESLPAPTVWSL